MNDRAKEGLTLKLCVLICASIVAGCGGSESLPTGSSVADSSRVTYSGKQSVSGSFELIGGYRLRSDFSSEGLALVPDANGTAVQLIGGSNVHDQALDVYDLNVSPGSGSNPDAYPLLSPSSTWKTDELFPRMMAGQTMRDFAVVPSSGGFKLAGIGRVYYNTSPRNHSQINVREFGSSTLTPASRLGASYEIQIDLPEQEFSGFIKHDNSSTDLREIGAGAYDSGQGSVGGLSLAAQQADGKWTRLLSPPSFGDIQSPRLPRDAGYSCVDPPSWVCIPPVDGVGIWSTERIGGGGVQYGDNVLFIATLGYGSRSYSQQSYTFGEGSIDKAVAYFFKRDTITGLTQFANFDRWVFAAPGERVIGVALGRLSNHSGLMLFVATSMTWNTGRYKSGSSVQIFRIRPS